MLCEPVYHLIVDNRFIIFDVYAAELPKHVAALENRSSLRRACSSHVYSHLLPRPVQYNPFTQKIA